MVPVRLAYEFTSLEDQVDLARSVGGQEELRKAVEERVFVIREIGGSALHSFINQLVSAVGTSNLLKGL